MSACRTAALSQAEALDAEAAAGPACPPGLPAQLGPGFGLFQAIRNRSELDIAVTVQNQAVENTARSVAAAESLRLRPLTSSRQWTAAMSWQAYIDDHLMCQLPGGGQLSHAAICGQDGAVWAQSEAFPAVTEQEIEALVRGFDDPGQLAQNGIKIGGEKYMMVAGEPGEVIRGKKGPGGVTVKKTVGAVVLGIYGEGVTPGECNVVVENLGDYLKDQGI